MEITIPKLETHAALNFAKEINDLDVVEPCTFCANMNWVRPFGMLLTACAIKQFKEKHKDIQLSMSYDKEKNGVSYAGQMGFFKAISTMINVGKEPGEATGNNNYIPVTELNLHQIFQDEISGGTMYEMGDVIEKKSSDLARILGRDNKEMVYLLTYLIREILRNIPEHANCETAWVCGQYWGDNTAEIAIIDEGIGILASLQNNSVHRKYISTDEDALKCAIKAGISQAFRPDKTNSDNDTWSNSGFGLYMVAEICKYLDGSFCLASGNKFLEMYSDGNIQTGDTSFKGTAVKIGVSTSKIDNSKEIIRKISAQGEAQARSIRHAFKKASVPSKGLIDKI